MIEQHRNEIVVFCNTENTLDREVLMYAKNHFTNVREVDLSSYMPTPTRLMEIVGHLKIDLLDLINHHSPVYPQYEKQLKSMGEVDILSVIQHNPSLLHTPIVISHDGGDIIRSLSQMMEFVERNVAVG